MTRATGQVSGSYVNMETGLTIDVYRHDRQRCCH